MQIQLLNQKLNKQFGEEPYFNKEIKILAKSNK